MTDRRPAAAFEGLRRLVSAAGEAGLSDGQLLELFVAHRDGAAFEALVRRHGPMVLGVCRRAARHEQDAEDAFQATFLVLARRAAAVSPPEQVGHWLYGVAYRTALKARAAATRRATRERPIAEVPEPVTEPTGRNDLMLILDVELNRLPALYRVPLVLCDLEDRPRKEVARQLGIPEGTLSSRLTAARQRLADRLFRRGVAVAAAAVGTVLGGCTEAVPPALLDVAVRGGCVGTVPDAVAALAGAAGRVFVPVRLAGVAAVLTFAGAVGAVVAWQGGAAPPAHPPLGTAIHPPPAISLDIPIPRAAGLRAAVERAEWTLAAVGDGGRVVTLTDRPDRGEGIIIVDGPRGLGPSGLTLRDLPVTTGAAIEVDGKPAVLADLRPGMRARFRFAPDRLTVTRIDTQTSPVPVPRPAAAAYLIASADPVGGTLTVTVVGTGVRVGDLKVTPATRIELLRLGPERVVRWEAGRVSDLRVGATAALDLVVDDADGLTVRRVQVGE